MKNYYLDTLICDKRYFTLDQFKANYLTDFQAFKDEFTDVTEADYKNILKNTYRHAAANIESEAMRQAASELLERLKTDKKYIAVQIDNKARVKLAIEINRIIEYLDGVGEAKDPEEPEGKDLFIEPEREFPNYVGATGLLAQGFIYGEKGCYYLKTANGEEGFPDATKLARHIKAKYGIKYGIDGLGRIIRETIEGCGEKNLLDNPSMMAMTQLYCDCQLLETTPEFQEAFQGVEKTN